jgi:hypothetical protein
MADALRTCRKPLANLSLALHVLNAMTAFLASAAERKFMRLITKASRPEPMAYSQAERVLV